MHIVRSKRNSNSKKAKATSPNPYFCRFCHPIPNTPIKIFELGYHLVNCSHTERLVGSIIDCAHLCLRENGQCRSINTEKAGNNAKQGGFKCQLNNSTKEHHAPRFKKNPAFNYYEPKKVHNFFVFYLSTLEGCSL